MMTRQQRRKAVRDANNNRTNVRRETHEPKNKRISNRLLYGLAEQRVKQFIPDN